MQAQNENFSDRSRREHREEVAFRMQEEPKRIDYAVKQLQKAGKEIHFQDHNTVQFWHNDNLITLYPYTGWHTGKGIKDGRGIANLLKQLK
jgi:hypothetical protein